MNSPTDQQLALILSVVQSKISPSAVVFVTAASALDDAALLSSGLTEAAKAAGHHAALVPLEAYSIAGNTAVQDDVDRSIAEIAAQNDILFVYAPSLLETNFATHIAQTAAGTILAVALGRKMTPRDTQTADALRLLGANVLGIVTTPLRPAVAVAAKAPKPARHVRTAASIAGVSAAGR
jgi:hypothetical protein